MIEISYLPGRVADHFMIGNEVASSRTVTVFKALDKLKREGVGLVLSRAPIQPHLIPLFTARVVQLSQITKISSYGLDNSGCAFLVIPALDGTLIFEGTSDPIAWERRFLVAVRMVAKLHSEGVICGDICPSSFLFDRSGVVRFFAGWCALEAQEVSAPSECNECFYCIAPEQRGGGNLTSAADVFALGVIGYRLFFGRYPKFDDDGCLTALDSILGGGAPVWLQELCTNALNSKPAERFQDAGALLQAIMKWKEDAAAREVLPAESEAAVSAAPTRTTTSAVTIDLRALPGSAGGKVADVRPKQLHFSPLLKVGLLSSLIAVGLWIGFAGTHLAGRMEGHAALDVRPGDVSGVLVDGRAGGDPQAYIEALATSGDPLAHDILVRMFKDAATEQVALKVWESVLARARQGGLIHASDYVRAWAKDEVLFRAGNGKPEKALRLLDPALPMGRRIQLIESVVAKDRKFGVTLAASLALDLKQLEPFSSIFISSAAAALAVDPSAVRERSVSACMLATPEVSTLYADEIMAVTPTISDADLLWLLGELTKRQLPGIKRVSHQIVARQLVVNPAAIFLDILNRKGSIPARVQSSLVACATKQATKTEVVSFAGWYDTDAEKALWALIVITEDQEVAARAFDALAAKPLLTPGISPLYESVRTTHHAERSVVSRPIAVIALEQFLPDAEFSRGFEGLDTLAKSKEFLELILKGSSTKALREVVTRYGHLIGRTQLLPLIKQPDPLVRAAAVVALKDANDIAILKILSDSYAEEEDPSVRAAYEENIAVIKERVSS